MKKALFTALCACMLCFSTQAQKTQGLALTPPMGWNSWNTFASNINETLLKEMVDAFVASGMKDAGYQYFVIDDCWLSAERDKDGKLQADPKKFPNGMKAIGDYVHAKGLKFGMYNCAGTMTCAGLPGTRGNEYLDARTYASWGVDYLKYDWCNTDGINQKEAYTTMSKALTATGRPIVFSLCEWGGSKPWEWAKEVGHLWRSTGDIFCGWSGMKTMGTWSALSVMHILELQVDLRQYAGPGHWNDPDMLEVGNGLSVNEDRAHFTMWAMLASPLMAGNDLRKMSKETVAILTNKDIIALNQDSLGIQALRYANKDSMQVWVKPLKNGDWAVCFLNIAANPQQVDFDWKTNVVKDEVAKLELNAAATTFNITDLWTKKKLGTTKKNLKAVVPSHDVLVVRLTK